MPLKLKTRCRYPGCPLTTRSGFCDRHKRAGSARPADQRRGTPAERGYDARWYKLRAWYIRRHPLCADCLEEGVVNATSIEVDHVIPVSVRPDLRLDASNLRSRCRKHHSRKTELDKRLYGERSTGSRRSR